MPFTPNHITTDEVEAIYAEVLCEIERHELKGWLVRLQDPSAAPNLEAITRAREAIEADLRKSRDVWQREAEDGDAL